MSERVTGGSVATYSAASELPLVPLGLAVNSKPGRVAVLGEGDTRGLAREHPNTISSIHVNPHCRLHELARLAMLLRALVSSPGARSALRQLGWTLIELLYVLAILGTLVAIATPQLRGYRDKARVARAAGDIEAIQADLAGHELLGAGLPETLAEIGRGSILDPWGNPYQYLKFPSGLVPGSARKDMFLIPINTSYDLYSMGEDGQSQAALTVPVSKDDVIRANDGGFIGLASKF